MLKEKYDGPNDIQSQTSPLKKKDISLQYEVMRELRSGNSLI